jgi:hypothetical protein
MGCGQRRKPQYEGHDRSGHQGKIAEKKEDIGQEIRLRLAESLGLAIHLCPLFDG